MPNIVLVIGCTVRTDQVTPYGGFSATTPFLDDLAEHGARFADAIDAAPSTRTASTAILSGRHFRSIGMAEPGGGPNERKLAPEVLTLAEALKAAGYQTIGGTANPALDAVFGFDQGFDEWRDATELWRAGAAKVPGFKLVDQALEALDARSSPAPVYLQLLLVDAHEPDGPEAAETAAFDDGSVPPRVLRYRAMLNRFDRYVQRLYNGLQVRGFDDSNTIFVVVNDHGEGLEWPPEDGAGHGDSLYPASVLMTWIARGEGVVPGRTLSGMASQVDVFPTLAGFAGATGYEGPGVDRSGLLRGQGDATGSTRAFVDTDFQGADKLAVYTPDRACEIDRRPDPPVERCFDRRADPYSRKPLDLPDPRLLAELRAWREDVDRQAAAWPYASSAVPSADEEAMADALGYADRQP
jgi:arylsulfatase A-like enzyme